MAGGNVKHSFMCPFPPSTLPDLHTNLTKTPEKSAARCWFPNKQTNKQKKKVSSTTTHTNRFWHYLVFGCERKQDRVRITPTTIDVHPTTHESHPGGWTEEVSYVTLSYFHLCVCVCVCVCVFVVATCYLFLSLKAVTTTQQRWLFFFVCYFQRIVVVALVSFSLEVREFSLLCRLFSIQKKKQSRKNDNNQ